MARRSTRPNRDPDEVALLQMIIEQPEEDTPRLVYADWLEEHGNPERAEFIRVQCELAQLEAPFGHPLEIWGEVVADITLRKIVYDPCRDAYQSCQPDAVHVHLQTLLVRQEELHAKHREEWLAGLPTWTHFKALFRRGFVEMIQSGFHKFVQQGSRLMSKTPLLHAELTGDFRDIVDWTPALHLSRLQTLELRASSSGQVGLGPKSAQSLARSGCLDNLTGLAVRHQRVDQSCLHLLRETPFRRLQGLDISSCQWSHQDFVSLLSVPGMRSLKALNIGNVHWDPETLAALRTAPFFAELTHLALPGVPMQQSHAECLAGDTGSGSLIFLHFNNCSLNAQAMRTLAASPLMQTVQVLSLGGNGFGNEGVIALAESPYFRNLRYLNLSANRISNSGIKALAQSPNLANIGFLLLRNNDLTNDGARALIGSPHLQNIRVVAVGKSFDGDVKAQLKARFGDALVW